jgi:protein tyrosine/serine phosphatase
MTSFASSLTLLKRVGAAACAMLGLVGPAMAEDAATAAERHPEWAQRVGTAPNFYRVTPTLYRSAQLGRADVAALAPLGIRTVVGLRAFHSDDKWLKESGIAIRRVKIYTWAISDANVVSALKAIRLAEKDGPVLLHCWHGADRTGLIAAMYRILYQGWSKEQALDELENGGYGYHAMWKNIPKYLRKVDIEKIRAELAD